ncbi:nuclear protein localization protein 4 [Cryptococcus neoformans]|nr:nuclear protein localization protein 4 [Cryptococcus neoformans var. grubii]
MEISCSSPTSHVVLTPTHIRPWRPQRPTHSLRSRTPPTQKLTPIRPCQTLSHSRTCLPCKSPKSISTGRSRLARLSGSGILHSVGTAKRPCAIIACR